jgi:hypothetical protein
MNNPEEMKSETPDLTAENVAKIVLAPNTSVKAI